MPHCTSGYSQNQLNSFCYFLSQKLSFKNDQKVQFQTNINIQVAIETKMRRKTKLACVQLFKFVSIFYMLYKLISAHLYLLVILFQKLRPFCRFCYCIATLVVIDTQYRTF